MSTVFDNDDYCDCITDVPNAHRQYVEHNQMHASYVNDLIRKSEIKIKQPLTAKKAYEDNKEHGLFNMFFCNSIRESMRNWTNLHFSRTGTYKVNKDDLDTFFALEMAMGLRKNNNIQDYWSKKEFLGDDCFRKYQSRRVHLKIRSNVQTHPPSSCENDLLQSQDPLWHSQHILRKINSTCNFRGGFAGAGAHDEMSFMEKGRYSAKTCIPSKPIASLIM